MGDIPRGRDYHVAGPVGGGPEGPKVGLRQASNALLTPGDLPAEGRVAEHREVEERVDMLAGVVQVGTDLLHDDGPLGLDLLAAQTRSNDQLPKDVHAPGSLAERNPNPVDGRLAIGCGIEAAAYSLDGLRDGPSGRVCGRPLERYVLHEMGRARLLGRFQPRTGQNVGGNGDGASPGEARRDDPRPARQGCAFVHPANASR